MSAVPSGPSTACGVSTWISNPMGRSSPSERSMRSEATTMASTWATLVTLGSVTTKPSGPVDRVVLLGVRTRAEAVLEVDPEVFDGLGGELAAHRGDDGRVAGEC